MTSDQQIKKQEVLTVERLETSSSPCFPFFSYLNIHSFIYCRSFIYLFIQSHRTFTMRAVSTLWWQKMMRIIILQTLKLVLNNKLETNCSVVALFLPLRTFGLLCSSSFYLSLLDYLVWCVVWCSEDEALYSLLSPRLWTKLPSASSENETWALVKLNDFLSLFFDAT